ncbi:Cof-type HAD-IIB family hydrolase [Bacillus rubiinfantis]|uniref:Cof-type HAD-IIB family hydrolase n=1 Tax=Bacillus rubiinfantis TaxID=1499680 RepID=UPI0005AB572F|nr:Cof-type HAD-IIB family hydrolase [Bacillus rubiinfantis]
MNRNRDIKLIALDMDGTLLNNHQEISAANHDAIAAAQARGVKVVLSTGRSFQSCRPFADLLGLESYLVTVNGSEIWDEQRSLVERIRMDPEEIEWLGMLAKKYQTSFWTTTTDGVFHNELPADLSASEWLKFGFYFEKDLSVRETVLEMVKTRGELFEISNSALDNLEINHVGVNKASGLKKVCERLGLNMFQVMAIGDSLNDMAMVQKAGLGVAMANAQDTLKEAADWITSTNENDGVAHAIEKWVLANR